MPSEKPGLWLQDIFDNIVLIERFTAGMDFDAFNENKQALDACLHALQIVSEAARKLGDDAERLAPTNPGAPFAASATCCAMNTTASTLA